MDQPENNLTKTTPIWEGRGRMRKSQSIEKLNAEQKSYLKSSGKPLLNSPLATEGGYANRNRERKKEG